MSMHPGIDRCGLHWGVSQYQSGETSPKADLDRTISGLLGIHFSMSVIA
jgi:hypothetical protein